MEINQPKSIKPKARGHKLKSSGNLQWVLKQTGIKQMGGKKRPCCTFKWFKTVALVFVHIPWWCERFVHGHTASHNASTWWILILMALLVSNSRHRNTWIWNLCALGQCSCEYLYFSYYIYNYHSNCHTF